MFVVAALAALARARLAHADERIHARLTYAPDGDVERCPSEREVKDSVAARLGYDPFVEPQRGSERGPSAEPREVVVKVHRRGAGIVGSLELRGPRPGQRELASPHGDCREVLDAFAVAIAIGLDPSSLSRPPADEPAPLPPPAPVAAPPSVTASPAPASAADARPADAKPAATNREPEPDLRLGAGPVVMFGELPATAPGLGVAFAARWRWFEPTVEGLATLPVTLGTATGQVSASLLAVGAVPCAHVEIFFGCVGVTVGALRGEGEGVAVPLHGSQLYAAASGRAGAELALSRAVWVRGYAEAVAPMTRITLQLAAQDVWRMPSVAARVGAAVGVRF
jgi:hypothetical protein